MKKIDIYNLTVRFNKYKDKNQTVKSKFINFFKRNNSPEDLFIALRNITLSIRENDMVGIIGDNGSRKSTLCKVICGIYEYENNVKVNGRIAPLLEMALVFILSTPVEKIFILTVQSWVIKNMKSKILKMRL